MLFILLYERRVDIATIQTAIQITDRVTRPLFGKPIPYVVSEIQRRIKEALLQDDRINGIENFIVTRNGNKLLVSFDVSTIKGVISVSKEVVV